MEYLPLALPVAGGGFFKVTSDILANLALHGTQHQVSGHIDNAVRQPMECMVTIALSGHATTRFVRLMSIAVTEAAFPLKDRNNERSASIGHSRNMAASTLANVLHAFFSMW